MLLKVIDLAVYYDVIEALAGVNIEVDKGECVLIAGPNGAGKTTLLSALSGLLLYRSIKERKRGGENINIIGDIVFEGRRVNELKPWDRVRLGLVLCPERRRPFIEMTTEDNLKAGAYLRRGSDVEEDLELVYSTFPELKRRKDELAGLLSGGEQQMLAVGRALMSRPKLLLMDEPLLGLSTITKQRLCGAIKKIRSELGIGILMTEQDIMSAVTVCERGYVLERGAISFSGSISSLIDRAMRMI